MKLYLRSLSAPSAASGGREWRVPGPGSVASFGNCCASLNKAHVRWFSFNAWCFSIFTRMTPCLLCRKIKVSVLRTEHTYPYIFKTKHLQQVLQPQQFPQVHFENRVAPLQNFVKVNRINAVNIPKYCLYANQVFQSIFYIWLRETVLNSPKI